MAKGKSKGPKQHQFRNKLVLNQWLLSLFGINLLEAHKPYGRSIRPFHILNNLIPRYISDVGVVPGPIPTR
jgi:hypothetical protein